VVATEVFDLQALQRCDDSGPAGPSRRFSTASRTRPARSLPGNFKNLDEELAQARWLIAQGKGQQKTMLQDDDVVLPREVPRTRGARGLRELVRPRGRYELGQGSCAR
jgi:hypothetical protein